MEASLVVQAATAVATTLLAVWLTARMTARETRRAVRAEVTAQRLTTLADQLVGTSRDLREILFAGDACASCGRGIAPAHLIELAQRIDRTVDLALVHVRDDPLRDRLHRVTQAAGSVMRHRKSLSEPCDDLLSDAYTLIAVCDQLADQCLNVVHDGRAVVPPRVPMTLGDRAVNGALKLVERFLPT
jgi:hypothetical protein